MLRRVFRISLRRRRARQRLAVKRGVAQNGTEAHGARAVARANSVICGTAMAGAADYSEERNMPDLKKTGHELRINCSQ